MSDKIRDRHLARKAVLYVRQSSTYQATHYEESRRLQYAMGQRLRDFGWKAVDVIDEDLGLSASGTVERTGFQRMVAEVSLDKVGIVAARELSRFARNSRDWQQLIEVCRIVDTLLMDVESIYDPRNGNDRLLLGLKGSLNEYELDLLRQRSLEARRQKARRGELVITAPIGYRKTPDQRLEMDPDLRVQHALRLIFEKFLELGAARQTMMWFIEHGLELPFTHPGPAGWETVWKRPSYRAVMSVLRNPIYAGAYVYGRTEVVPGLCKGRPQRHLVRKSRDDWSVLIRDHHAGYITWEQFQRIDEMISKNAQAWNAASPGAPKKGQALLSGLLRCRRCGRKLSVRYTGDEHKVLRYVCCRGRLDQGENTCISFGGIPTDEAVSREILQVVQPGAVEAALQAGREYDLKQDKVLETLALELKAARFEEDRAARQYDAADPQNRLVVDELERRWNEALKKIGEIERRLEEARIHREALTTPAPSVFEGLAGDLEKVWGNPATESRLKKRIVRALVEEIVADIDAEASEVVMVIHWKGGAHTDLRVTRRRRGQHGAQTSQGIIEAVRALASICDDTMIAGLLNRNGLRTGRGNRWIRERVTSLRSHWKISPYLKERRNAAGWMNLGEAADYLGVTAKTVRRAVERGIVLADHPLPDGPWILKRDNLDMPDVRRAVQQCCERGNDPAGPDPRQLTLDPSTT